MRTPRIIRATRLPTVGPMLTTDLGVVAATEADASPSCGSRWGSLSKSASAPGPATISNIRTGRHACYDRIVIDGASVGSVRYVSVVRDQARGDVVPLRGGAKLEIVLRAACYDLSTGSPTYTPPNPHELTDVSDYSTFRQVAWGGSFEGDTTIGLGVRARLPMRIFTLPGPGSSSRLVIDVAHQW
jgi:hypothetical protein